MLTAVLAIQACSHFIPDNERIRLRISFDNVLSKAYDPDECRLNDFNIFLFNDRGVLEYNDYATAEELSDGQGNYYYEIDVLHGNMQHVCICANAGYEITVSSLEELMDYDYYLAYPDDYSLGIPMSGIADCRDTDGSGVLEVCLKRTMAKISIALDRSFMDRDVDLFVKSVKIGACPRSVSLFGTNSVNSESETFPLGFIREGEEVRLLNEVGNWGKTGYVDLFMFENMQGNLLPGNDDPKSKIFPEGDPRAETCSYIEIRSDYVSDSEEEHKTVIYRFYIGDNPSNFDVMRNCHYRIYVTPYGDALGTAGWRMEIN